MREIEIAAARIQRKTQAAQVFGSRNTASFAQGGEEQRRKAP